MAQLAVHSPRPDVAPQAGALKSDWLDRLNAMDYAYQPLVNIHTGSCFGFEALLRGFDRAGFSDPRAVFDAAAKEGVLYAVDVRLRDMAINKFVRLPHHEKAHLFLNLDNRTLETINDRRGDKTSLLATPHLRPEAICYEISEQHDCNHALTSSDLLKNFKRNGFRIAVDDFGAGYSGLQLLYNAEPDFIKIDRFFISGIGGDTRKASFVAHIVNLSHLLGILVIAEGVETEREFYSCKEIGCDFVQGYFIQRPTTDLAELKLSYESVLELSRRDRRRPPSDEKMLIDNIEAVPALCLDTEMSNIFEQFRQHKNHSFFPVVNATQEPVGLVTEFKLKGYVYSMYGKDVLRNRSMRRLSAQFLTRCPIADINTEAEKILEIFSLNNDCEGIIITRDMKYLGFLSAKSLLRVIHEKGLLVARDQNPLTKLPGNYMIYEYLSEVVADSESSYLLAYLDFDNFKPFNDTYGFRKGDRVIQLFAELLKKDLIREQRFIAHIGGDDFFVGFKNIPSETAHAEVRALIRKFQSHVESFYDPADLAKSCITARDRDGKMRTFALMTVSAAILDVPAGRDRSSIEEISGSIAELKKASKKSVDKVCTASTTGLLPRVSTRHAKVPS